MLKNWCVLLGLMPNHIIKNFCVYYKAKFKKLTWLQAYVLGDMGVI